jgi:hypothetical protein
VLLASSGIRYSRAVLVADARNSSSSALGPMVPQVLADARRGAPALSTPHRFLPFLLPLSALQNGASYLSLVCLSARNNSRTAEWISMKVGIGKLYCNLVNCFVGRFTVLDHIESSGGVNDELEWIWKEPVAGKSSYYPGIFLEEMINPAKAESGEPVLQLRFEPSTTRTQVYRVTATLTCCS